MILAPENLAEMAGVSPISSTIEGIMLQILMFVWSIRESTRLIVESTPTGPITLLVP
jgi:hypothetical protein